MSVESKLREQVCGAGASLFNRGLTHGSTGNISVALPDGGWLMTPTGSSLGTLDPARLSKLDAAGNLVGGDAPTKEAFLHTTMYDKRPKSGAVVHLHSTHSVAVSCLDGIDHGNCLPPMTAYYVMRIGTLPLVPYFPPGAAQDAMEELEETARLFLMLRHEKLNLLNPAQIADLQRRYPS
jgi:3-dehydro-4-phosphotetronate decarboxylase